MIDWVTILLALIIIAALVGGFTIVAMKINMSDPLGAGNLSGKKDEVNQLFDSTNDKKRKDKNVNDQKKKKRNVPKKSKRDNKEEDEPQHVKFIEPSTQTSEDTDNEREESEQESSPTTTPASTPHVNETSSKARKRKNKARAGTPPPSSGPVEGILVNKDEKSPVTDRPQIIPHPKLATGIPKDEVELAKQHAKTQGKPSQATNKQPVPAPVAQIKKPTPSSATNTNQTAQKQQQQQQQQEQPFTVVGKGHKTPAQPAQQQPSQQQQQTKSATASSTTATPIPPPSAQQQAPVQVQHEQLAQRQPVRQQKETSAQPNGYNPNSLPVKQPATSVPTAAASAPPPTKLADLVKALPTSQVVVTELMSALDAFPLTTDELNIIMQKIANKQSLIKQDWSKLQHGQRVDPQVHIGQMLNESARAYEEDLRTNAVKRIKELTDELQNDKRRINDLMKESSEKDINMQLLRSQLNSMQHQHPQQHQQFQTYEVEYRRLADENMQLKQRLTQQQQHFQQQQQHISSLNLMSNNNNTSDPTNVQARVVSDQIKKLSIDNGKLEKQLETKDLRIQEIQKEKDALIRSNQQLTQKIQESQTQFQHNEKILKEFNENRTLTVNQMNEYKRRIDELESINEKLRHAEAVHVEPPTLNNEDRNKFEQEIKQLTQDNEQYKKKFDEIQSQYQSKENELRKEIEQLKTNVQQRQQEESLVKELSDKNTQIELLRKEIEEVKARNDTSNSQLDERVRQEHDKQKQFLTSLLEQDVRNQLPNDNQDFNQWLSSYQQLFASSNETSKRTLQEECNKLKHENDQLHKNMNDVENQLKDIEQTVQSKEESLFAELQSKDVILESVQHENGQLSGEMQRLRAEIDRLQLAYHTALQEGQGLKRQLDERSLLHNNSSSSNADDSYEFLKQLPSLPIEDNTRIDQLHELIRSGKEALENQDSIVQQLDKHLNEMHRSGTGETLLTNVDESTSLSPSTQEQTPSES